MSHAQFENVNAVKTVEIAKMQTAQTIRINTKDNVVKILSCGIDSAINSYECMKGEASFFGRTNVRLLFIDETGAINSANYNADFTDRLHGEDISSVTQMQFETVVVDYKTDINENVVTIQAVLEVNANAFVYSGVSALSGGEAMFARHSDIEIVDEVTCTELNLEISEELTSSGNINRVLLAESNVAVNDFTIMDGVLTVHGDAIVNLLYVSGEEIRSDKMPFSFTTEIEAKNLSADRQVSLWASTRNTRIRLDILEDEINNAFTAEISMHLQCTSTTVTDVAIVDDAYTTDSELTFSRSQLITTVPCGNLTAKKVIEQTVPFSQKGSYVSTTNLNVVITKCASLTEQVAIEGILCGNMLFKTDDGYESTVIELPFTETLAVDYITPLCKSRAKATVSDIAVKLGSSVTVTANLNFVVESSRNVLYNVITGVDEIAIEKGESCAIEVCLARKGETLWQLAKGLHISEQDILNINPEIVSPLEQDTKIVIYNAL